MSWWLLAGVSGNQTARAGDVDFYAISKQSSFQQTSATQINPTATKEYHLTLEVEPILPGTILGVSVLTPAGRNLALDSFEGSYQRFDPFATLNQLDAAYPAGPYTFRISGKTTSLTEAVLILPSAGPLPPLRINNFDAAQTIDPKTPFILEFQPASGASVDDFVVIYVLDLELDDEVYGSPDFGLPDSLHGRSASFTIPAGVLAAGKHYAIELELHRVADFDQESILDSTGYVQLSTYNHAQIRTRSQTTIPVSPIEAIIVKQREFLQNPATTAPALLAKAGYRFQAIVNPHQPAAVAAASLKLPSGVTRALPAMTNSSEFTLTDKADTANALSSAYPAGNYSFTVTRSSGGLLEGSLSLPQDNYPAPPRFANLTAAQTITAASPFVLEWDPLEAGRTNDYVYVDIRESTGSQTLIESPDFRQPGALTGRATSFQLPANGLKPGSNYLASVTFYRVAAFDSNSTPGLVKFAAFAARTEAGIKTATTNAPPINDELDVIYYGVEKQRRFLQTSATSVVPDGNGAFLFGTYVVPYLMRDILQATAQGPDGRSFNLQAQSVLEQWLLEEYYPDKAKLDASRPPGTYTLNVGTVHNGQKRLPLVVPADNYPLTPQFTSLGGGTPVNPFLPFDLEWFPLTNPTEGDYIDIYIEDTATGEVLYDVTFSFDPFSDDYVELPEDATTVVVPAGLLELGSSYIAKIVFWRLVELDQTTYPGVAGYVAYSSSTSLRFATVQNVDTSPGVASQIVLRSDERTLAAPANDLAVLNSGDARDLAFFEVVDRPLGSTAQIPPNSPGGTKVVNVSDAPASGFFRVEFELPVTAGNIKLSGVGNMDDVGRVFLNGNPLTPSLVGAIGGQLRPTGNASFNADNPALFRRGDNELLIANYNPSGGGSGGAFYATVTFNVGADIEVVPAPVIYFDPENSTVDEGDEVYFDVIAVGDEPLSYQWRLNGVDLPGETEDFLYIETAAARHLGDYTVVVRNASGSITSRPARLDILIPPDITTQPQGAAVAIGASLTLRVGVAGPGPFFYQWLLNGEDIDGATSNTLALSNVQPGDSGDYSVIVEGPLDTIESDIAAVIVNVPALTLSDSYAGRGRLTGSSGFGRGANRGATKEPGEPIHAFDGGGSSVWIGWVAPATGIATINTFGSSIDTLLAVYTGANVSALQLVEANDDTGDFFASQVRFNAVAGREYAIAIDGFDGEKGNIVIGYGLFETTNPLPVISRHPLDVVARAGSDASFSVTAQVPAPATLTYQWYRNGTALPNANANVLTLHKVQVAHIGEYVVRVTSGPEFMESFPAYLELNLPDAAGDANVSSEDKFASLGFASNRPAGAPASAPASRRTKGRPQGGLASGYSGTQIFSTYGSTTEAGEPNHCGVIGGASQWYSYLAEASGPLTITTDGSDFDTVLAVYTGPGDSFETLQMIACDNNSGADGRDSSIRIQAAAGTVYHVAVDGVAGASGNVKLAYSLAAPARLSVSPQPAAGSFGFALSGQPGARYTVQVSSNLVNWTALITTNIPNGGNLILNQPAPPGQSPRFFRARAN